MRKNQISLRTALKLVCIFLNDQHQLIDYYNYNIGISEIKF